MPRLVDVIHAERFGPPMGVQGGMGMGVNLFIHLYSVHFCLQHIHVFDSICGDGAISAAAAKVMRFTSHHALELKCSGDARLGEGLTSPQQMFSYVFRLGRLLARAHSIAHPRMVPYLPGTCV